MDTVTALCSHKISSIFRFVPLGSPLPGSLPAVAIEAPEEDGDAEAAEEDGVTSEDDTELTDTEESLSLVRGVVDVFLGTAPPLSLSLLALSFFLFAEDVGLLSGWREEDEAVSNAVDEDGVVRLGGGLKKSSYLNSATAKLTSIKAWKYVENRPLSDTPIPIPVPLTKVPDGQPENKL